MYRELLALSKVDPPPPGAAAASEDLGEGVATSLPKHLSAFDRAFIRGTASLEWVDPEASLGIRDASYPNGDRQPSLRALAFREVYGHLYP